MTDIELLEETAAALFGPLWQSELARALDVAPRTVRRWAAGDTPVPPGIWADLQEIIADRQVDLTNQSVKIRRLRPRPR
jgi:hypothetical protein